MHGTAQFTPQQLLESGRRAEADGRPDLAQKFYRHLSEQYGYTAEAADARAGNLLRPALPVHAPRIWQHAGQVGAQAASPGQLRQQSRPMRAKPTDGRQGYRSGRALAVFAAGLGWVAIAAAVVCGAAGAAAYALPLKEFRLPYEVWLMAGAALPVGAALVLAGQAARALFDQAAAAREILALERARRAGAPD